MPMTKVWCVVHNYITGWIFGNNLGEINEVRARIREFSCAEFFFAELAIKI